MKSKPNLTRREYRQIKRLLLQNRGPARDLPEYDLSFFSNQMAKGMGLGGPQSTISPSGSKASAKRHEPENSNPLPAVVYTSVASNFRWVFLRLEQFKHIKSYDFSTSTERYIAFGSQEDLDIYNNWYETYIKKYREGTTHLDFPMPIDGIYPHMVPVDNSGYHEYWIWCLENCEDEVRIAANSFFFKNASDAALFKLQIV